MFMGGGPGTTDPERIRYTYVPMKAILIRAFQVMDYQILGPGWLADERLDITAKVPPNTTKNQFYLMLQNLLAERFKMTAHSETRELPIYALVAGKRAAKIQPAAEGGEAQCKPIGNLPNRPDQRYHMQCKNMTMAALAEMLRIQPGANIDRVVVDATGMEGAYDFAWEWSTLRAPANADPDPASITMQDALETQLGLKLEPRKGPVKTIVVDHIERTPTGN